MNRLGSRRILFTSLLVACIACPICGQAPTGSIVGIVSDATGASVVGTRLVLTDIATQALRNTVSSRTGSYEFLQIAPGNYELSSDAQGFRHMVQRQIVVNVGSVVRLDLTMQLGSVNETIDVNTGSRGIEPDRVSIGSVVDLRSVQSLPLQDRQFLNLALIVPGTIPGAPGTRVAGNSIETFSVAGMRSQSNNYSLDGMSNNDPHVDGPLNSFRLADAVQEFDVETSIPGPDAGRSSGAQVRIVTKSGGDAYHGTLFYYLRNDVLDATPFFLNRAGLPKNPLQRNQFGGTIGGFIRRDKSFWFASFEGYRQTVQLPATARIPTDAERATVTDPISQSLLEFWPRANTPDLLLSTGKNWTGTTPDKADDETYLWRVDQNLMHDHRLTMRYAWFTGTTLSRQSSPFNGLIDNAPVQRSLLVQDTYSASQLVNHPRFGYSSNSAFAQPADRTINPATIFLSTSGEKLPGYIDTTLDPLNGGLPTITINGFTDGGLGVGPNFPQGRTSNTFELLDDLALTNLWGQNRHTLMVGGGVRFETDDCFLNAFFRGSISFANWNAFGLGQPQRGSTASGTDETFRVWSRVPIQLYAQDIFRPRPNLTFNFGLRWEYPGVSTEKQNRGSNFVPDVGQLDLNSNLRIDVDPSKLGRAALLETPVGIWLPASGQFSVPKKNFEPFVGFAYSPAFWPHIFADSATVIRMGIRVSNDDVFQDIPTLMGLNFPGVFTTTLPRGSYTWATVLNQNLRLFAADPTVVPQGERGVLVFSALQTRPVNPYAMNYALEIERRFAKSMFVGISYSGSEGRKLVAMLDPNQPAVTVNDLRVRGDQAPNLRTFPFPQYSNILQAAFVGTSNFNALTLSAREQSARIAFTAAYELSKSLDENSGFFPTDGDPAMYADSKDRSLNYGLSSFDIRHRVIASFVYKLPFWPQNAFHSGAGETARQILKDWTVSGITNVRSGYPFTVRASSDVDFTGLNRWNPASGFADRPDMKPGVTVVPQSMSNPDRAFAPQVFSYPLAGTPGNVRRNSLLGPHFVEQDLALAREFPIREVKTAQLRVEAFNFFNHTNFKLPENRLDQSAVGKIGASYDPRVIQLSLRMNW